ncbi:hypothetical protein J8J42_12875 [Chryseobacterium sp. cx-311]|uniref:hypothetical protein n=1 Tax=Marnyiella aurantia TaxID=2758037 RepID=UPI001AE83705|nr:hypothetical protein [Marnyiella aurantia]MBP0613931.1 hypothetical protein [Marnyiella aurantia]
MKEILLGYTLPHQMPQFKEENNVNYNPVYIILRAALNALLAAKKINLRSLLNNNEFQINQEIINVGSKNSCYNVQYSLFIVFSILKKIYDSSDYLREILIDLEQLDKERFRRQLDYTRIYDDDSYKVLVDAYFRGTSYAFSFEKFYNIMDESQEVELNPFTLLRKTFERIKSITSI